MSSAAVSQRPASGGTFSARNVPLVTRTPRTCSGSARPVTVSDVGAQTPIASNTRFSFAYVTYIDNESRNPPDTDATPGAPGATCETETIRSASGYGSGFSSTLLTTLKTAVLAPMPIASVSRAIAVKVGLRRRARSA